MGYCRAAKQAALGVQNANAAPTCPLRCAHHAEELRGGKEGDHLDARQGDVVEESGMLGGFRELPGWEQAREVWGEGKRGEVEEEEKVGRGEEARRRDGEGR